MTIRGFRIKIPMKLVYQCMAIFFNFSLTSNHLYRLQADSNSRLAVDEDDNAKVGLERVIIIHTEYLLLIYYILL